MLADFNASKDFKIDIVVMPPTRENAEAIFQSSKNKVKQFTTWINPKNWFSRFSTIEIDMSEFACKKSPKNSDK